MNVFGTIILAIIALVLFLTAAMFALDRSTDAIQGEWAKQFFWFAIYVFMFVVAVFLPSYILWRGIK